MYQFDRLHVHPDAHEILHTYSPLIPDPRFHCCLLGKDPFDIDNVTVIVIAASLEGHPAGLAVATCGDITHDADIYSLYVHPEHRRQHVGLKLMQRAQEETEKQGGRTFTCIYPLNDPFTSAMEKIFSALGWRGSRAFMLRCFFDVYHFNTPWLHHDFSLPSEYEVFPWSERTAGDRNELKRQDVQGMIPAIVSPFIDEEHVDPRNSLGLRRQGKVVGWCLTHLIAPDTLRYTSLFVLPSLQFRKLSMRLLSDSIKLHISNPTPWAVLDVPLLNVHYSWVHLVKHRLVPYADKVIHFRQAWHVMDK